MRGFVGKLEVRVGDVFVALSVIRAIKFSQMAWSQIDKAADYGHDHIFLRHPESADYVNFFIDRGESCMILKPIGPDISGHGVATFGGAVQVLCQGQVVMVSLYQLENMFARLYL